MSYSVKRGKLSKRQWKVGDPIIISHGVDADGGWWWVEADFRGRGSRDISRYRHGGPFRTRAEAQRDSEIQTLGPQCKITEGGMWDPAWDRPQ
jgi:hypothetical protein